LDKAAISALALILWFREVQHFAQQAQNFGFEKHYFKGIILVF